MFVISSYLHHASRNVTFSLQARKMATATMKAAVVHKAGGPEVLQIETRPIPKPNETQVLIRIKAFGLYVFPFASPLKFLSKQRR